LIFGDHQLIAAGWVMAGLSRVVSHVWFLASERRARRLASARTEKVLSFSVVLFNLLEKIMAKQKTGKSETSARVIKQTLTKSALINLIAEQNDIPRKTAIGIFQYAGIRDVRFGTSTRRGRVHFARPV
jgi:hypothetical protein